MVSSAMTFPGGDAVAAWPIVPETGIAIIGSPLQRECQTNCVLGLSSTQRLSPSFLCVLEYYAAPQPGFEAKPRIPPSQSPWDTCFLRVDDPCRRTGTASGRDPDEEKLRPFRERHTCFCARPSRETSLRKHSVRTCHAGCIKKKYDPTIFPRESQYHQ